MRAFMLAIAATLAITLVAASVFWMLPMSAADVYIERANVRL